MNNIDCGGFNPDLATDYEEVYGQHLEDLELVVPPEMPAEWVHKLMLYNQHLSMFTLPPDQDVLDWYDEAGAYLKNQRRLKRKASENA